MFEARTYDLVVAGLVSFCFLTFNAIPGSYVTGASCNNKFGYNLAERAQITEAVSRAHTLNSTELILVVVVDLFCLGLLFQMRYVQALYSVCCPDGG